MLTPGRIYSMCPYSSMKDACLKQALMKHVYPELAITEKREPLDRRKIDAYHEANGQ